MSTENNNLPARRYEKKFAQLMAAVFGKMSYFGDFFGGGIEALDGIQDNETAFYVKTSDIPCVLGKQYDKGANVAFGSGTSTSNRFGERKEIVYKDTPVPYRWEWVFHEGLDKHTVNNDLDAAVADRLELQAQAKVGRFNEEHGSFISSVAQHTENLSGYTNDEVLALLNALSAYYTNIEAHGVRKLKARPQFYNAIVDHPLVTTAKNSKVNIDDNEIVKIKGFMVQEVPDDMFQEGEVAYVYIENVGKAFTGIETARTFAAEGFDGLALQGAGKAGEFILEDNKKAVAKVLLGDEENGLGA